MASTTTRATSSVRTSEPRLVKKRAGGPITDPNIRHKKTNVKLEAIIILDIERSYVKWNSERPEEYKWIGEYKQLTTQDKQKVWKILPINSTIILDNLPEPNLSTDLQQAIKDIKYKEQAGYSFWEVENHLQANVQMRRLKYGFLKLFSNAAGKEAVEALIEDLLGIYNSAPIYEVRNIGGNSRSDDNAHLIGFQFHEIDSTSEDGDFKFNPPSNASTELDQNTERTSRNREVKRTWPTDYNFPDIVDKYTFVPDGTCKLIDGNMLLIESVKSGFGDISERSKKQLFYECCTDLTKQKELAGLILNAQQAVLFHFLRDDTESTIVTRMNTYDFTGPETNNLEKLCKDILKLITKLKNNLNSN